MANINIPIWANEASVLTASHLMLSPGLLGHILAATLALYLYIRCPLRALPGPWYTKFTDLILKYYTMTYYIHSLHQHYGPIIRVGPSEADILDIESFKTIHKTSGGFWKSSWYRIFRKQPVHELFTVGDPSFMGKTTVTYNSSMKEHWEALVRERTTVAVSKIKQDAQSGDADILKWWTLMSCDIITTISFGGNPHLLEAGKLKQDVAELEFSLALGAIRSEMKFLFDSILALPIPYLRHLYHTFDRVREFGMTAVRNRDKDINQANIFANMISEYEKGSGLTDDDIACEATSLITAGSATTAVTQTYLIWTMLRRPDVRAALEEECASLPVDFTDADMEKLPVLAAIINETLRLHGAAQGNLSRLVPPGGTKMGGYYLRGGITVCTQAYSYHRDPEIFPDHFHEYFIHQD